MKGKGRSFWDVPLGVTEFDRLPSAHVAIHPAMSEALDPITQRFCEHHGISIWDRDKLFRAIAAINPNPENV